MNSKVSLDNLCDRVHEIFQRATLGLQPAANKDGALVRKKISVFTWGICTVVAHDGGADRGSLYYQYLLKGGLHSHQARVVVERTSLEFVAKPFGKSCFDAGVQIANNLLHNPDAKVDEISAILGPD